MMKSTYYRECPDCGANLDPGEICDCKRLPQEESTPMPMPLIKVSELQLGH